MKAEMRKDRVEEEGRGGEEGGAGQSGDGSAGDRQVQVAARLPTCTPPACPACAQPRAPLCVGTLLHGLWGRWGVQAGWALWGRVPHLQEGINTCGDHERGGSKVGWKAPAVVRPTRPYTLGASIP